MLNLKDYGSSSDDEGLLVSKPLEILDSSVNVHELTKKFAVNAAPDVLPPVSFYMLYLCNMFNMLFILLIYLIIINAKRKK